MGADDQDGGADMTRRRDQGLDADLSCTPEAVCEEACGEIDDGCGGVLDCGACGCVEGVPVDLRCGACGFGQTFCEEEGGGHSAVSCSLSSLASAPEECAQVIHVRSAQPSQSPDGSRENPFATLGEAMEAAAQNGATFIALAAGEYALEAGLTLLEGVHVVGGFTPDFFFDEEGTSTLVIAPLAQEGNYMAIKARDLVEPTWLKQLDVQIESVAERGTLYGVHAVASPGLRFEEFNLFPTSVSDGASGADGQAGMDGIKGGDAALTSYLGDRSGQDTATHDQTAYVNGADAGEAGTNTDCAAVARGGAGGEGAHIIYNSFVMPPAMPLTVFSAERGKASAAGLSGGSAGSNVIPNGEAGQKGMSGMQGMSAASGVSSGSIVNSFWSVGGDGQPGEDGTHGTGGSGGGGSWWMEVVSSNERLNKPGASGGGGGAGGCGGKGGGGGQAGSSSFGMLLIDSEGIVFDRVLVRASAAGDGGDGGQGGRGGLSGQGGAATTMYENNYGFFAGNRPPPQPHSRIAGLGGAGGAGGEGGAGGAGAGGSSFGVYCEGASSVMRIGEVVVEAGQPGNGGETTDASAQDGQAKDVVNCW